MMPTPTQEDEDLARWSRLTARHREVLDLLVDRKTSKEIARILNLSKPAIDQRFATARPILGAANRNEAAIIYARLRKKYDRVIYDPVQVPPPPTLMPSNFPDGDPTPVLKPTDKLSTSFSIESGSRESFLPSRYGWGHKNSIQARVVIMVGILVALVIVAFLGLGIAESLTRLVSN
jgi:DNA-binding CsgD family transcriptional regulator